MGKAIKELRSLAEADLDTRTQEIQKELLKVNVQVATGANPSSPGRLKQLKKNLARIKMLRKKPEVD